MLTVGGPVLLTLRSAPGSTAVTADASTGVASSAWTTCALFVSGEVAPASTWTLISMATVSLKARQSMLHVTTPGGDSMQDPVAGARTLPETKVTPGGRLSVTTML